MTELPIRPDTPWLAPLAGWSDLSFRLLCREQGAAVCCTEMVSAKGLVYGGRSTESLLATTPEAGETLEDGSCVCDRPLVVQIFGAEAAFLFHSGSTSTAFCGSQETPTASPGRSGESMPWRLATSSPASVSTAMRSIPPENDFSFTTPGI